MSVRVCECVCVCLCVCRSMAQNASNTVSTSNIPVNTDELARAETLVARDMKKQQKKAKQANRKTAKTKRGTGPKKK